MAAAGGLLQRCGLDLGVRFKGENGEVKIHSSCLLPFLTSPVCFQEMPADIGGWGNGKRKRLKGRSERRGSRCFATGMGMKLGDWPCRNGRKSEALQLGYLLHWQKWPVVSQGMPAGVGG